jgi:hypothetical protein
LIQASIYDAHQNVASGIVSFMPLDSVCSPLTSILEIENWNSLTMYPNPTTGHINISLTKNIKDAEVVIYDMLGKEMVRKKMNGDRMEIERGSLESGVYFVRVSGEERQWVQKIVVE